MESKTHYDKAISISFNQDYSLFSIGTERGYKIYQTFPMADFYEKNLLGGISICQMSYNSNFLAIREVIFPVSTIFISFPDIFLYFLF